MRSERLIEHERTACRIARKAANPDTNVSECKCEKNMMLS